MTLPLILSLLTFSLFDLFQYKYKDTGRIFYSELYKVFALLTIACFFWMWTLPFKISYIFTWILWHYPIQQTFQGTFRMSNPLYLGVGVFDRGIRFLTGNSWWMYLLSLLISLWIGWDVSFGV
jgi:hypothetical protein